MSISHVTWASAQGPRDHQEDRWVIAPIDISTLPQNRGLLLAVLDGHGGATVAAQAAERLPALFLASLIAQAGNAESALKHVFQKLEELTRQELAGATATVVYIREDPLEAFAAILGDSPLAALDESGELRIGPEHNVRTNIAERQAAEARGGVYVGGYIEDSQRRGVGLQMARTLGDAELSRILNRNPDVIRLPLGRQSMVLLATDGLWTPFGGDAAEQLQRYMQFARDGANAQDIVNNALAQKSADNVTVILWKAS